MISLADSVNVSFVDVISIVTFLSPAAITSFLTITFFGSLITASTFLVSATPYSTVTFCGFIYL